ncbi:hypothetical protein FSB73_21945 [Arachidicoccus ginsenosidivorans]|uniref:Uncharacterized protein n=1 Tax=Arachidicoccus ginsenosidivorans TaxID=496057 RepID=A0A5B8VR24_9BACT|nr:hypothetical protein [Arachidicoccus ginsenosidivorans]QEC73930.1 hypothetical protein FSB73_21945 [Arachidicoccus ginsenosidivorans]
MKKKTMEKWVKRMEEEIIGNGKETGEGPALDSNDGSMGRSTELKHKTVRPFEHQIAERIQLVLNDPDNYISLPEDIHRQILKGFKKSAAMYYEHSSGWLLKIRHFCDWLKKQNTSLAVEKQLADMLEKLTRRSTKKGINELFQLLYTDKLLLGLSYIYYGQSDKDWAFLDKLIWQTYVPYPDAMNLYGKALFEKAPDQDGGVVLKAAYAKWEDFLTENYYENNPYDVLNNDHGEDDDRKGNEQDGKVEESYKGPDSVEADGVKPDKDHCESSSSSSSSSSGDSSSDGGGSDDDKRQAPSLWADPTKLIFELPEFLRLGFREAARKSADYYLRPVGLPERCRIYLSEAAVYEDLPKVKAYMELGKFKYTKSGFIAIGSIKNSYGKLKLSPLGYDRGFIKTMLLASHLDFKKYSSTAPVLDTLSQLLKLKQPDLQILNATLFPFNNLRELKLENFNFNAMADAFDLLRLFPEGEWIELGQLMRYLNINGLLKKLNPLKCGEILWVVKIAENNPAFEQYNEGDLAVRMAYLRKSFITGVLLTAATFGLLDLACDPKDYNLYCDSINETYPWTSFTACRLTPLGAHFFKGKKDYSPPVAILG